MPVIPPNQLTSHPTTGAKIIRRALRLLKAIDPGEPLTAGELEDSKETLNQMLDSWNTENLSVYVSNRQLWPLAVGTAAYTIGKGEDFDTDRPPKLVTGDAAVKDADSEWPLEVLTQQAWLNVPNKSQAGRPWAIYYEPDAEFGTLFPYYVPDRAYQLVLYNRKLLAQVIGASEVFTLPPGYVEPIVYNLAVRLAPEWASAQDLTIIAAIALHLKSNMQRTNMQPILAEYDGAFSNYGLADIRTGGF